MNAPNQATDFLPSNSTSLTRPSIRAQFVERRTYLRPLDEDGSRFETPDEALDRVIGHQRYLWERQVGRKLNVMEEIELDELRQLMADKKVSASGRVKWMGGTDVIKERASAAFNCSFTTIKTPADMVDAFWLLLQGCGVGFKPLPGLLTGFASTVEEIAIVPSTRTEKGGEEHNSSWVSGDVWHIKVGDSAMAWAKLMGKLMGDKPRAKKLVISLEELRPGGKRLRGYGWLSSGWEPLANALKGICAIMMRKADTVLSAIDIGDIVNFLGTVLSSRRSAQIWLLDDTDKEIEDFIDVKVDRWEKGQGQREQSNNSIMFWSKPDRSRVVNLLERILDGGDPGFVNAAEARRRAPEMEGFNPCAEILLPSKGFCNLMQVVFHRFNGDLAGLERALWMAGRANYRQTCVSMKDGVLQLAWEDNQKLLRLCGVSPTGYVSWEGMNNPLMLKAAANAAKDGANAMADELGLQRPRRVTQVQPAGTSSKVLGLEGDEVHEGAHLALSRYVFNNVNFSKFDEMLPKLEAAGYRMRVNPNDPTGVLVTFPVAYPESPLFTTKIIPINGTEEVVEVNEEPAINQLERYKMLMDHYVDHNCSITVSFEKDEIEAMADWFMENWDSYVGVSFLKRNDPTKTAADLGFNYLPQEAVSKRLYEEYAASIRPVDLAEDRAMEMLDLADCARGSCPVR
jgi:adenosylcobalamin-dependent ribonucleoside-triphosphate reductase